MTTVLSESEVSCTTDAANLEVVGVELENTSLSEPYLSSERFLFIAGISDTLFFLLVPTESFAGLSVRSIIPFPQSGTTPTAFFSGDGVNRHLFNLTAVAGAISNPSKSKLVVPAEEGGTVIWEDASFSVRRGVAELSEDWTCGVGYGVHRDFVKVASFDLRRWRAMVWPVGDGREGVLSCAAVLEKLVRVERDGFPASACIESIASHSFSNSSSSGYCMLEVMRGRVRAVCRWKIATR